VGLGVTLLLAAATIAAVVVRNESAVRRQWRERLVATAEERKASILEYLDERSEDAEVFASFPSIRLAAGATGGAIAEADHIRVVFETGRDRWGCRTIALLDARFVERLRAGEPVRGEVLAFLRGWGPAGRRPGLVWSGSESLVAFAAPVRAVADGGAVVGWIVLVEDAAATLWPLLQREPVATRSGEVLLAGEVDGRVVYLSPVRNGPRGGPPPALPVAAANLPARDAVAGRQGFGVHVDYEGHPVLAATRHLSSPGWGLVVKVDVDEAYAGLRQGRLWAGATFLAVLAALVGFERAIRGRERLRASEEQRREFERHRSVLAHVRDAIIWVRPGDGRILEANRAAEALWGWDRAELQGRSVVDLRSFEAAEEARTHLRSISRDGVLYRARHVRKDGTVVPVEVSARALSLEGEEVIVAVVRDVSENEEALEKIRFLNRLLRTINAVDQALVGVRDRDTVLAMACEEIVRTGEFTVASFGVPDGNGGLGIAASAGKTEGFFEEVGPTLRSGPGSPSGAGTAYLEGRTVVVDDWETDPLAGPVREAGLKRGYLSSAACPVRSDGAVRGVLSVYASERGAFVPEAVLLLEDLARDLGLALELVESEARRREAEASLLESEERYRELFDQNPAPMWVYDLETFRFLAVNEAATGLYGWTREEFLARTIREVRPVADVPALEAEVLVPRSGVRRSGPWRHLRKDGSELRVEIVTHDVDFEGRAARLVLANDVTERLRVEEKLRAFFDSGMAGAIFGDVHGNVLAANDEYLRIVGYTREDLESGRLRWTDITPPQWLPVDAERIAEAKERGVCTPYEKEYLRKDGRRVPVLVGYALVGESREESVAFVLDLTERKEAEARLAETTRLLQAVVEGSPAPILTLDAEGRATSWNPAAEAVFGWSRAEVVGRPLPIVPPEAEDESAGFLAEVLSGRSFAGREVRRRRRDGSLVDVSVAAAPLRDAAGTVTGVAEILVDVSARLAAEEEVRALNAELELRVERRTEELLAKSKELESFAYSISHDLRAPLRAIDGFSRVIEEEYGPRLDDEGHRLLDVVRGNARRMGQLIDDLLVFSRAGRQELRKSRVDAAELVRSVVAELVPKEEVGRTELVLGDLPAAMADPSLLRQVFVNILSNAVKFSAGRPRRRLEVRGRREAGRVIYEFIDDGVGFDMRFAGKLFGVFQRLHGREFEGTGVGLALVERIVARHGGTVTATGEVGRGATFTVSLPDEGGAR